jgi:hypothetical protein
MRNGQVVALYRVSLLVTLRAIARSRRRVWGDETCSDLCTQHTCNTIAVCSLDRSGVWWRGMICERLATTHASCRVHAAQLACIPPLAKRRTLSTTAPCISGHRAWRGISSQQCNLAGLRQRDTHNTRHCMTALEDWFRSREWQQ